ncbi:MAG TPA: agmatine deiminase family protein [Gammaproteobacteria bacterium]|nr:agmatine deiminase family protein [Gammaproteobacteria bacterium]
MPKRILPAEWAPQSGVMLTWPHPDTDWQAHLDRAETVFAAIAREVTRREALLVVCRDADHRRHVAERLAGNGVPGERTRLFTAPSNDAWARDHGPVTVLDDGVPVLLDFTFNGWGGKYPAELDNRISRTLHEKGAFGTTPRESVDYVLEGGAIDSDGMGGVLVTESCLLNENRNRNQDRRRVEQQLGRCLGVDHVLWLGHGALAGDDTDGHVDTLARFCDPHTIAYVRCDDPSDEHYRELQAMEAELQALRDREGRPYQLVPLPWPAARRDETGRRLPATYANFLVINEAVLMPVYDDPADRSAARQLAACFPGRTVVPIDCRALIVQNGSLHCVTMQLPARVLA